MRGAAVLDCANGYQKKNQEEVEDSCQQEGDAPEKAGTEGKSSQEISEEESRSEQIGV
jgi:hypothetical protein